jgi:hypothetical protein
MPDRDRRRFLIVGYGSFAFAWLLVLVYIVLGFIFDRTRWFGGTDYAVRMDGDGLVIWRHFTYWTTFPIPGLIFLAFGISGVLCLTIGMSEIVREAVAHRKVPRAGFEVIVRRDVLPVEQRQTAKTRES